MNGKEAQNRVPENDEQQEEVTLEDLEATAEEFGRVVAEFPDQRQLIVADAIDIGPGMVKQFRNSPEGFVAARRFAVRLRQEDEESKELFEDLRVRHLKAIGALREEDEEEYGR